MSVTARQHNFIAPAARLFLMQGRTWGIPIEAFHRYIGPTATFVVKLASLFTVANAQGPEMDQGETVTLLSDTCLFAPSALLAPAFSWDELGPRTVRVHYLNAGSGVSAVLSFSECGSLEGFISEDRFFTTDGNTFEQVPWSTPVTRWQTIEGRRVPEEVLAVWHRGGEEFCYARFRIVDARYNLEPRERDSWSFPVSAGGDWR